MTTAASNPQASADADEVPCHRSHRLPRLAVGGICSPTAATMSSAIARPGGAERAHSSELEPIRIDAGDPAAQELIAGRAIVLHFAGVPDPAAARADPARAVRENAGTTANLLGGCLHHHARLIYPSTVRAALNPLPDAYALSKWLGEQACRRHPAPATVVG